MSRNQHRQGKKQVNLLLSPVLHARLVAAAAEQHTTMNDVLTAALRHHLGLPSEEGPLWESVAAADTIEVPVVNFYTGDGWSDTPTPFEDAIKIALQPEPLMQFKHEPFEETP